ncbi:hypothetical protein D3C86_1979850 [compost metagenome]
MTGVGFGHQPQRHPLGVKHVETIGAPHIHAVSRAQRQYVLLAEKLCDRLMLIGHSHCEFSPLACFILTRVVEAGHK